MRSTRRALIMAGIAIAVYVLPIQLAAQHSRYKLIDIGTLGGPSTGLQGNGVGTSQFINSRGTVVGSSETSIPDPYAPNNCGMPDCLVGHAFRWQDGVLTDLGALPGGNGAKLNGSGANAINARGWIAGFSLNGEIDPVSGFPAGHAVLWKGSQIFDLGTLGMGIDSGATYIDNGGEVVGISTVDTTFDPFAAFGPFRSLAHTRIHLEERRNAGSRHTWRPRLLHCWPLR